MTGGYVVSVEDSNTVPRHLAARAERYGDKVFIDFPREKRRITYQNLLATSQAASTRLLESHGIESGSTAAILLGNGPAFIEAWFACLFAGIVDVPVNHELRKSTLRFALETTAARTVFTDTAGLSLLLDPELAPFTAQLRLLVLAEPESTTAAIRADMRLPQGLTLVGLDELCAPGPANGAWTKLRASALTSIRYTSGTTGNPKGIMHTHLHMLAKSNVQNKILEFSESDLLYSPFPLHHNLSSINGLIGALQVGGSMISAERFSASRYWPEIRETGATIGHILPPMMPILLNQPPSDDDRKHNIRYLWTTPRREDFCARFGVDVVNSYSLSEVGTIAFRHDGGIEGSTATGVPIAEMEVRIADELDRPLPAGRDGEILIRPDHPYRMLLGYYNDLPATMRAFRNLWYHTGDRGLIDAEGQLHFLGRMGDTIRRRGVNISSEQLTAEITRHPEIEYCAVIGVPSSLGDEEILAAVVLKSQVEPLDAAAAGIVAFLHDRLPRDQVPRYIEFAKSLPLTNTGKVRVADVRRQARSGPVWDRITGSWISDFAAS
jgi:crotonobetaine/carnitine-CoA ligase